MHLARNPQIDYHFGIIEGNVWTPCYKHNSRSLMFLFHTKVRRLEVIFVVVVVVTWRCQVNVRSSMGDDLKLPVLLI